MPLSAAKVMTSLPSQTVSQESKGAMKYSIESYRPVRQKNDERQGRCATSSSVQQAPKESAAIM